MPGLSRDRVVTPEAVALDVDAAGLGSRMIAALIDLAIQAAVALVVALAFAGIGLDVSGPLAIVLAAAAFLLLWGYYPLFEALWGATPGKRAQRLRVVTVDGQPAGAGPVLVRNLLRPVDLLPGAYGIGAVAILLTRRSQRIGDLAAGTMVIRQRRPPEPQELALAPDPRRDDLARRLDVAGLDHLDHEVVRSFLRRRGTLDREARAALARRIATAIREKVRSEPGPIDDETFLEAVASAIRAGPGRAGV